MHVMLFRVLMILIFIIFIVLLLLMLLMLLLVLLKLMMIMMLLKKKDLQIIVIEVHDQQLLISKLEFLVLLVYIQLVSLE